MSSFKGVHPRSGSRACDACHLRKVKCEQFAAVSSPGQDSTSRLPCKPCHEIRVDCTFDRPTQRYRRLQTRGRLKALHSIASGATDSSTPSRLPTAPGEESSTPNNHYDFTVNIEDTIHTPTKYPSATVNKSLRLERVCGAQIAHHMIGDYVSILYPLIPVVHLPSFQEDLANKRAESDPVFFSLLLSMCAMVAVLLPRRFLDYQRVEDYFPYDTPAELAQHCANIVLPLRDSRYHEIPSPDKCAIAFMLGYALGLTGAEGRGTVFWAEMGSFLRNSGAQDPRSHLQWNFKESQLYKKLFWMWYIAEAHARVGPPKSHGSVSWMPFPDTMFCNAKDIDLLLPVEIDDEYISDTHIGQQPQGETSLTTGFNILVRIYLCFMVKPQLDVNEEQDTHCGCCIHQSLSNELRAFGDLFRRVRYVLSDLPSCLAPWTYGDNLNRLDELPSPDYSSLELNDMQLPTPAREDYLSNIRANIHVTQLWARYVIFERLVALHQQKSESSALYSALLLSEHEALCEQLLYLLSNIPFRSLESNGVSITFKIRQIAALLLQYQSLSPESPNSGVVVHEDTHYTRPGSAQAGNFHHQQETAQRARRYIDKFVEILTRLDAYTFQDTQQVFWNESYRKR